MRTLVVAVTRMLCYVSLPVGLVGELQSAMIADKRFYSAVRSHVGVKQALSEVGLLAELALKRPGPHALVLPLMIQQVAFRHEGGLADVTRVRLLALVLNANVLVDTGLVEHLLAHRAAGVERALLVLGQEIYLMFQPDVSRQARAVDEDLSAVGALLGLLVVLTFLVPVQVTLRSEDLAAVTKELLRRLDGSIVQVGALVLRQVAVAAKRLAAKVTTERRLARVHSDVLPELVGRVEPLLTVAALERTHLEVASPVVAQ
jgi:hypothetical protein